METAWGTRCQWRGTISAMGTSSVPVCMRPLGALEVGWDHALTVGTSHCGGLYVDVGVFMYVSARRGG